MLLPNLPAMDYRRHLIDQFNIPRQDIYDHFSLLKTELHERFNHVNLSFEELNIRFADLERAIKLFYYYFESRRF